MLRFDWRQEMEKFFKTYEVAKICQVAQGTVIRWIHEGKLPASSTAGGHNRIRAKDLIDLLKSLNLPLPEELFPESVFNPKTRVLIVDDEPEIRRMIRWMIEQDFQNVQVEEAQEGFIAGWKTNAFRPHLVILDLMLPGIDGFQVCGFIRQFPELKETKIIAISALMGDPDIAQKILDLGADDFLTKPFDLEILKKKVRVLLNGKKGDSRAAA